MVNLSATKINTFGDCPRKFKYQYINHYRQKIDSANLEFGKAIHSAMERFFLEGENPVRVFEEIWLTMKDTELNYSKYDNWDKLMNSGIQLMELFMKEEVGKFIKTYTVEDWLKFPVDSQTDFWGRGDWIGRVRLPGGDVVNAIIDFKTSSRKYDESKIQLNDQLTAYFYAGKKYPFKIDKVVYVVFVKTKTPYIQWVVGDRGQKEINEFLQKVNYYNEQIQKEKFIKKYGMSCQWCDYQALCLGDEDKIKKELIVQVSKDIQLIPGKLHDLGQCPEDTNPMDYVQKFVYDNRIEGNFIFTTSKSYGFKCQEFKYKLKGTELQRIYKDKIEREVA